MDINNVNDEDEDIVIQGTSLYEHLHNLGYTDFESVTVHTSTQKDGETKSMFTGLVHSIKNVFKNLLVVYLKIVQDNSLSKKQVETILNAKALLHDHACTIQNFLDAYNSNSWRTILLKITLFGAIVSSSVYIPFKAQYKSSSSLFGLSLLFCVSYIEYSRLHAHRDLKTVIALQNDLFDLCKKGLKILKHGYKIKLSKEKSFQQFYDLTADRLKYLQPIMESIVKCLEHVSCTCYRVSLVLMQLLPVNAFHEDLLTKFDSESFNLRGEITYQKLRNLYHTYILTQSEMLYLIAIAYNNRTWQQSYRKVPEFKLAYIVDFVVKRLVKYKNKLAEVVNAYYNFKLEPTSYKYKGSAASRWQDLYMHLYLASNKLQIAYGHILSILQDIDNDINENMTNEDMMENTIQKLNIAQKDIETAKGFIEFSSLFLVKSQIMNSTSTMVNTFTPVENSDIPVVHDSEPQIMDEVFEEYIKEEYFKPLSEEDNEITLYNYKKDKSLFKNFMAELKDVLIDKQKSMSERELKALQRMRKHMTSETSENQDDRVHTPPQIPSLDASTKAQEQSTADQACNEMRLNESSKEPRIIKTMLESEKNIKDKNLCDSSDEEKPSIFAIPLPENREFSLFLPPPLLKTNEETFIGSGENSEDEIVEVESEK